MVQYREGNGTLGSYRATEVNTANRLKLLIMLYEGMTRFTKRAEDALKEGNLAVKGESISRALAIVDELNNTLDYSHAPDLAANLSRLYGFIRAKLVDANLRNDVQPLQHAQKIIKILQSAWTDLSKKTAAELAVKTEGKPTTEPVKQQNSSNYFRISV